MDYDLQQEDHQSPWPSVAYQKTKEGSTTDNEERCQLDTPCSPLLKEQVPSAKPLDLSMTIPYVSPFL